MLVNNLRAAGSAVHVCRIDHAGLRRHQTVGCQPGSGVRHPPLANLPLTDIAWSQTPQYWPLSSFTQTSGNGAGGTAMDQGAIEVASSVSGRAAGIQLTGNRLWGLDLGKWDHGKAQQLQARSSATGRLFGAVKANLTFFEPVSLCFDVGCIGGHSL